MTESEFRAVYDAEFGYVERTLRRLGVRDGDLADLTHDVFVVVFRRWDERRVDRPQRAWLFGIALKLAANYRNRSSHTRERAGADPDGEPRAATQPSAEGELDEARNRARLLAALAGLDLAQRAVIVLHDIEGRPAPDIATSLEIPLNTVYSRLRVARHKVITALRREQGDDP